MGMSTSSAFDILMQQLGMMPLWIKHVIYTNLRKELEATLSKPTLEAFGPEHTLQLWVPELTRHGLAVIEQPAATPARPEVIKLLHLAQQKKNILTITVLQHWSLEESTLVLSQALDQNLLIPPHSMVIVGTLQYLAGRIRLGEYLVKINRLTIEGLDQALRTQKAIEEAMGERTGIANVLINLGYIKKEDSEAILFLKEESKKPFQWNPDAAGASPLHANESIVKLQTQLQQALKHIQNLEAAQVQNKK